MALQTKTFRANTVRVNSTGQRCRCPMCFAMFAVVEVINGILALCSRLQICTAWGLARNELHRPFAMAGMRTCRDLTCIRCLICPGSAASHQTAIIGLPRHHGHETNRPMSKNAGKEAMHMDGDRTRCRIIAIEEHFMHDTLTAHYGVKPHQAPGILERLHDFAGIRIAEMDGAGVDMQVLSHQSPGSQRLPREIAVEACQAVNDALAQIIACAPDRFAGFGMIPTMLPDRAADELQRAVEELGLKGAMIHGLSQGEFVDGKAYWPIFARAEALGVPIYLHPALPDREMVSRYLAPYDKSHPDFTRAAWGFGVEAGTQAVRMVLSGVFDRHPDLRIFLGHLGESIPFQIERIDESLSRPGNSPVRFAEIFARNFWITTSGFFSTPALRCCLDVLGPDRILFAVDWPYADNRNAVDWLMNVEMDDSSKAAIFAGNAQELLNIE